MLAELGSQAVRERCSPGNAIEGGSGASSQYFWLRGETGTDPLTARPTDPRSHDRAFSAYLPRMPLHFRFNHPSRNEFFSAVEGTTGALGAPVARRKDGSWWVGYPVTSSLSGEPWFAVSFDDEGNFGRVSFSSTSASLPRDVASYLEHAPRLAARLGCRVVEELTGLELTSENVGTFSDPAGAWAQALSSSWRAIREDLNRRNRGPFELPSGNADDADDFFVWSLITPEDLPSIEEILGPLPAHLRAHAVGDGAVIEDIESEEGVVRVFPLGPRQVQIWPYWSDLPFATTAREVLAALERAAARVGGDQLQFCGSPCTPELLAATVAHSKGLAVELYEWLTSSVEPTPFE